MEQIGFNLPAEMLEVYKMQVMSRLHAGQTSIEVHCDLLIALIERSQAWIRLESDERAFQKENSV